MISPCIFSRLTLRSVLPLIQQLFRHCEILFVVWLLFLCGDSKSRLESLLCENVELNQSDIAVLVPVDLSTNVFQL